MSHFQDEDFEEAAEHLAGGGIVHGGALPDDGIGDFGWWKPGMTPFRDIFPVEPGELLEEALEGYPVVPNLDDNPHNDATPLVPVDASPEALAQGLRDRARLAMEEGRADAAEALEHAAQYMLRDEPHVWARPTIKYPEWLGGTVALNRHTARYAAIALEASADNGDRYAARQIREALGEESQSPWDEETHTADLVQEWQDENAKTDVVDHGSPYWDGPLWVGPRRATPEEAARIPHDPDIPERQGAVNQVSGHAHVRPEVVDAIDSTEDMRGCIAGDDIDTPQERYEFEAARIERARNLKPEDEVYPTTFPVEAWKALNATPHPGEANYDEARYVAALKAAGKFDHLPEAGRDNESMAQKAERMEYVYRYDALQLAVQWAAGLGSTSTEGVKSLARALEQYLRGEV